MISFEEVCNNLNISAKKLRYYMFTKDVDYILKDNKFYFDERQYSLLKKIVLLRRLGLSLEDIDSIKANKNLKKYLIKMDNLIPIGNKYEAIKFIIEVMLKDDATFINMDVDKYLDLVKKNMIAGKRFYEFSEDMTYEDYKSSKFHREYMIMMTVLTSFYIIATLIGGGFTMLLTYFFYFFIGLILTFFVFYIPIRLKYYRRIINLLKHNINKNL